MNDEMAVLKAGEFERTVDWKRYGVVRVAVSPSLAQRLLARNASYNRNVRKGVVSSYASDMAGGKWNERVGDPIRFSDTGILIDGQHRLRAVAESGKTVVMSIMTGLSESDYKDVDNGASRTITDVVDIPGGSSGAAIIKASLMIDGGSSIRSCCLSSKSATVTIRCTRSDVVAASESRSTEFESVIGKALAMRKTAACGAPRAYGAFVYIAKAVHGEDKAFEFADMFAAQEAPTVAAYNAIRNKALKGRGQVTVTFVIGSLLQAFDQWVNGKADGKSIVNKQDQYIDKYDALLKDALRKRRPSNG